MTTSDDQVFLDDLVGDFYEVVGSHFRSTYERGQIVWTHVNYADEDLKLWRPTGLDSSKTTVHSFKIENAPGDAFNRSFPLYIPPLESHEEFVVVKAKRRPVIILNPAPPHPGINDMRQGGKVYRPICTVGPVFSLVNGITGKPKYHQEFINRIRKMTYPEFFFLPQKGPIRNPSYLRLGEIQATYQPHLQPENLKLRSEVLDILQGQVLFLLIGEYAGDYQTYREQLQQQ